MKALDQLIRDVPPGRTIVVRAQALGLSEGAFVRFVNEIKEDEGIDDFDLVQLNRWATADGSRSTCWPRVALAAQSTRSRCADARPRRGRATEVAGGVVRG